MSLFKDYLPATLIIYTLMNTNLQIKYFRRKKGLTTGMVDVVVVLQEDQGEEECLVVEAYHHYFYLPSTQM